MTCRVTAYGPVMRKAGHKPSQKEDAMNCKHCQKPIELTPGGCLHSNNDGEPYRMFCGVGLDTDAEPTDQNLLTKALRAAKSVPPALNLEWDERVQDAIDASRGLAWEFTSWSEFAAMIEDRLRYLRSNPTPKPPTTIIKAITASLEYIRAAEKALGNSSPHLKKEYRDLAAVYDSISDNVYVAHHDISLKLDAVMPSKLAPVEKCLSEGPEPSTYCQLELGHKDRCDWERVTPAAPKSKYHTVMTTNNAYDSILLVDELDRVVSWWDADPERVRAYLSDPDATNWNIQGADDRIKAFGWEIGRDGQIDDKERLEFWMQSDIVASAVRR